MTNCSHCGTVNKEGAKFCTSCGNSMVTAVSANLLCQACANPLQPGAKFCKKCGHATASPVTDVAGANNVEATPVQIQAAPAFAATAGSGISVAPALPEVIVPSPVLMEPPPLPVAETLVQMAPVLSSEPPVMNSPAMPDPVAEVNHAIATSTPIFAEPLAPVVSPVTAPVPEPLPEPVKVTEAPLAATATQVSSMEAAVQAEPVAQMDAAPPISPSPPVAPAPPAITKPTPIQQGDIAKPPVNLPMVAAAACVAVAVLAGGAYWMMNKKTSDDTSTARKQDDATSGANAASSPATNPIISPAASTTDAATVAAGVPQNVSANSSSQPVPSADIKQPLTEAANNASPVPASNAVPGNAAMVAPAKKAKRKTDDDEDDEDDWDNESRATTRNSQNAQMNLRQPLGTGFPANGAMSGRANAMLGRADDYIARRQYDKAIAIAESVLQLDPGNPAALAKLRRARQMEAARNY